MVSRHLRPACTRHRTDEQCGQPVQVARGSLLERSILTTPRWLAVHLRHGSQQEMAELVGLQANLANVPVRAEMMTNRAHELIRFDRSFDSA